MVKKICKTILFAAGFLFSFTPAYASGKEITIKVEDHSKLTQASSPDSVSVDLSSQQSALPEAIFEDKRKGLGFSHFTWGAEAGSSIDLTGNNLSTFDVDVVVGYKNSFLKVVGIGAGIHRSIQTGNNIIPLFAVFRSSFRKRPSLLFLNVQGGYSFNTISEAKTFGDWSGAIGIGINLSQNRTAKSYVIASCGYMHLGDSHHEEIALDLEHVWMAKLMIGINF